MKWHKCIIVVHTSQKSGGHLDGALLRDAAVQQRGIVLQRSSGQQKNLVLHRQTLQSLNMSLQTEQHRSEIRLRLTDSTRLRDTDLRSDSTQLRDTDLRSDSTQLRDTDLRSDSGSQTQHSCETQIWDQTQHSCETQIWDQTQHSCETQIWDQTPAHRLNTAARHRSEIRLRLTDSTRLRDTDLRSDSTRLRDTDLRSDSTRLRDTDLRSDSGSRTQHGCETQIWDQTPAHRLNTASRAAHLQVTDALVSGHMERVQSLSAQEQLHDELQHKTTHSHSAISHNITCNHFKLFVTFSNVQQF